MLVAGASLTFALATHFGVIGGPDFREGLVTAQHPLSLDPITGPQDTASADVGHLLYRSLLRLDATAYPRGDLATAYTVSTDGVTYQLTLQPGSAWSDGHAITAADVIATAALAQSPRATNKALAAALAGVQVAASGTGVSFTLPSPRASFAATLTQMPVLPLGGLPAARVAELAAQPGTVLATSGPFQVQSSSDAELLLSPNPHARQRPALTSFALRLFRGFDDAATAFARGEVDGVLATNPAQWAKLLAVPGARAQWIATFRFVDLLFNERIPGLDDSVVRHAITTSINRSAILDAVLGHSGGVMQVDAICEGLPWIATHNPQEPASPTAAEAALAGDGWTFGLNGVRSRNGVALAFTLTVPDAQPMPAVAQQIVKQLAPIGVSVALDIVPAQRFVQGSLVPHNFNMALGDWDNGPDPDISSFWRSNAQPPQGLNVSGGPIDAFLDQALDSLASLSDRSARAAAAADVVRFLADDAPAAFLYTPQVAYVSRMPLRQGSIPALGGSAGRFSDIAGWQRA